MSQITTDPKEHLKVRLLTIHSWQAWQAVQNILNSSALFAGFQWFPKAVGWA